MKKEDVEFFDLKETQKKQKKKPKLKKAQKTKKSVDLKETNITFKRVIVFFLVLMFVGGSIYYVIKYTKYFNPLINMTKTPAEVLDIIILNDVVYDLGVELKAEKEIYIVNNPQDQELILDLSQVSVDENKKTNKLGSYSYTVSKGEQKIIGKISVIDKTPPVVVLKNVYVGRGEHIISPELFIRTITDNSNDYVTEIANKDSIRTDIINEYPINFTAKDLSGNVTEVEAKLFVLEEEFNNKHRFQDLNVSYNDKNDPDWNRIITEHFESAINNTSTSYINAVERIVNYDWAAKVEKEFFGTKINEESILILYNQHNLIVGLTKVVNLTINNETKNYYLSY